MDHWGDPWADDKSPTKNAVTSPPHAPAPVLLNGFVDDAGWGNEDETFGDWTTSAGNDSTPGATETRVAGPSALENPPGPIEDGPHWETSGDAERNRDGWTRREEVDNVASETSDTSTTIPLDEDPDPGAAFSSGRLQPDDNSSARPSTSPSETSRNEATAESPRTSLEDESGDGKHTTVEPSSEEDAPVGETQGSGHVVFDEKDESNEDEFGTFAKDTLWGETTPGQEDAMRESDDGLAKVPEICPTKRAASPEESQPTTVVAAVAIAAPTVDQTLLDDLFPPEQNAKELDEAPDDPIYSTSARKAWYRLTRKQTMREFNSGSGSGDDNYIRVTWANSQVRSEVNKIVGRWAREDRISGIGPGARASFYWDTPAPVDSRVPRGHLRTKTSVSTSRTAAPVRQSLPPVTTSLPAAFDWSSPTAAVDPWKQDSPDLRSLSSPTVPKHTTADKAHMDELRAVSIDLTRDAGETQRQTATAPAETPAVAQGIPAPVTLPTATSSKRQENLSALDTNPPVQEQRSIAPLDDDDDWGEMISSPTVSTPISALTNSVSATRDTLSSLTSTPTTPPTQDHSADTMHIVRLRSTISPTSALFGPKSFVPLHAEQGPIGPGILKPAKTPVASTPEKSKSEATVPSVPYAEIIQESKTETEVLQTLDLCETRAEKARTTEPIVDSTEDGDFSAFTSNILEIESTRPSTPPPAPVASTTDSWADADLSFFESVPPTTVPAPQQGSSNVYGTPPRPTSSASSAKTFTRSPPRNVTPPPIQPLTGATNSAQRRKNEEEQVIREILAGLPDLRYMMR
ncbi:hypothetical protein BDW02DRAFT_355727 [Decorospora gaudefroyi]|uniref:Uncharacterized protein n=1 Tax=Decorospora gaudefroyi TaxID=184978 RepID=A0A6A5KFG8_9PLEO|nr:hypothetical protein BDW02DRAFT_355727 [Decorospora gaudefroyi]